MVYIKNVPESRTLCEAVVEMGDDNHTINQVPSTLENRKGAQKLKED